jgi:outer membrane protein
MKIIQNLFLVLGPLGLAAQDLPVVWTMEACVNYAIEHNLQIIQSKNQLLVQDNAVDASRANFLPSVNLSGNYNWNFGLNIDPISNIATRADRQTSFVGANANWVLFSGLRNINQNRQAQMDYMAATYDLKNTEYNITLQVLSQYLQLTLDKEIVRIAEEQLKTTELQVKRINELVQAGAAPRGNLYDIEAQYARDKQSMVQAQNQVYFDKLQLVQTLQLSNADGFEIAEPQVEAPASPYLTMTVDQVYDQAVNRQPNVQAAEARVESAEYSVANAKGNFYPTLVLQGGISTNYSDLIQQATGSTVSQFPIGVVGSTGDVVLSFPEEVPTGLEKKSFGTQAVDNVNEFVGLTLNVPIFNRLQNRNGVRNSKLSLENQKIALEQEKLTFRQTIQRALNDARASFENYQAAQEAIEASQESFQYAKARFEAGAINQFDFENSRNSLVRSESEGLRSKYDYIFKIKVLEFYVNQTINL